MVNQKIQMDCNLKNITDIISVDDGFIFIPSMDAFISVSFFFLLLTIGVQEVLVVFVSPPEKKPKSKNE